jgi:hypothetical protein
MSGAAGRRVGGVLLAVALSVAGPVRAATTAELLRCQKGIHTRAAIFAKAVQTALASCTYKVESCQLALEIDGVTPTQCLAAASAACTSDSAKVTAWASSNEDKALIACGAVPLADLEAWVAGLGLAAVGQGCAASSVGDLVSCVFDATRCAAERTLFVVDPRAQDALTTAGIAAAHPCVAP